MTFETFCRMMVESVFGHGHSIQFVYFVCNLFFLAIGLSILGLRLFRVPLKINWSWLNDWRRCGVIYLSIMLVSLLFSVLIVLTPPPDLARAMKEGLDVRPEYSFMPPFVEWRIHRETNRG